MDIPTRPGLLPAYDSAKGSQPRVMVYNHVPRAGVRPTNLVKLLVPGMLSEKVSWFSVALPADPRDGFDAAAVDRGLAALGWRRSTEWDWPESVGTFVAGIERTT
jgi:hypothetical protein